MDWNVHCPECGYIGFGRRVLPGSDAVQGFLWWLLLVPGLLYRIWRVVNARTGCARCDWDGSPPVAAA